MKRNNIIICLFSGITLLTACHDLDLNPLSYGSTNYTEIRSGRWMRRGIPIGPMIIFIVNL